MAGCHDRVTLLHHLKQHGERQREREREEEEEERERREEKRIFKFTKYRISLPLEL